ncbi:MAG: M28 family peptidase [Bacteroidales bacterium]|nr:M28 family peptidase [Bacteroidales bacterium]
MSANLAVLVALTVSALPLCAQRPAPKITEERAYLNSMFENIKGQEIFETVKFLSDSVRFQGRLSGSEGMLRAVEWVEGKYAEIGLETFDGLNGYRQDYPTVCDEVVGKCYVKVDGKKATWAVDWFSGGTSANGTVEAEVVFAGYGVTAPDLGYDDYAGIDVKGKIVLIEGETPNTSRDDDTLRMWYPYTLHQHKVENAVKHGAVGMLYRWVAGPNNGYDPSFVYAYVNYPLADRFFEGREKNMRETLRQIRTEKKPASFATGRKAKIKMTMRHNANAEGHNLIGFVKGSDPELCNEYVILSAHLDHLGMVPHHIAGANDNNSSTACLLAVAEALAKSKVKPKRSVIFLSLDGEEAGLTGSLYYCGHPVVPKEKVKFILNLEQIGIGDGFSANTKYDSREIAKYVLEANEKYIHRPVGDFPNRYVTRPRTDGAVFMKNGYPTTDIFGRGGVSYYHEPRDTWEIQDPSVLEDAAQLLYWSLINAANCKPDEL